MIRTVPGAADSALEQEADQAQLRILIKRPQVARFGINVEEIQQLIELALGGRAVSTVFEVNGDSTSPRGTNRRPEPT